jgi:hypothetical protein
MSHDANDWRDSAIEKNRAALLRIIAVLFVYAGLDEGGADMVPRRVWRMVLRLLRPAESAARRLIVIAARGIEVAPPKPRPEIPLTGIERLVAAGVLTFHEVNLGLACAPQPQPAKPEKSAPGIPAFPLTDPPRRFDTKAWDGLRPFPRDGFDLLNADEEVDARHLCCRILSLKAALDDLPRHARRLARREARAHLASRQMQGGFAPASEAQLKGANQRRALRLGHPPGFRKRPSHAVDHVLAECHSLALSSQRLDSS